MPAEVLYRKWRPQRFADVAGQDVVTRTLLNAVSGERVSHAYLFAGPRGTGKTTMARLLGLPTPAGLPGQDLLAQALFGMMAITGQAATGPRPAGASIIDHHGAALFAMGILAAIVRRQRTGQGCRVDASLMQSALAACNRCATGRACTRNGRLNRWRSIRGVARSGRRRAGPVHPGW